MPKASKNKKTSAAKVSVTLYWVSTPDHDEDWFIFAKGGRSAAKFHADYEGYAPGEAMAEPIVEAPGSAGPFPRHAQINDLAVLGVRDFEGRRSRPQRQIWRSHLCGGASGIVDSRD
jgi:hypothetical protein